jgi:hypothetical protein
LNQGSHSSHKVIRKDLFVKEYGHSRILSRCKCRIGEAWKNQGLGLDLSEKTYTQNDLRKFECIFGKEFKAIKTPMSEGYHPEIDDLPLYTEDDSAKYRSIIACFLFHLDNCLW